MVLAVLTASYGAGSFGVLGISPLSPTLVEGFALSREVLTDGVSHACVCGQHALVDTFLIPHAHEFPAPASCDGSVNCNMAAADNALYAERFVAPLLRHVVRDLGLASVRLFNPVNEPMEYGVYQTPAGGPDVYRHYVDMYRADPYGSDTTDDDIVARVAPGNLVCNLGGFPEGLLARDGVWRPTVPAKGGHHAVGHK